MTLPPFPTLHDRIAMALREDLAEAGDVTTNAVFDEAHRCSAHVFAKEAGILAGLTAFTTVFEILGGVKVKTTFAEGHRVVPGDVVVRLSGRTRSLLSGERTALNLLQRMSGVATQTARMVEAVGGRAAICDTRKTTPLWRDLEKAAVLLGGGMNHRMGLHDMVMLKDTHADGAGGLSEALRRVAPLRPPLKIAAEARNLAEVRIALAANIDLLMLDNMDEPTLVEALRLIKGSVETEITGGITYQTAPKFAAMGVDRLSVGAITHSVKALDFSMKIDLAP